VAVLDVDHFKRINDTFGHPAGDEVLRKLAATIRHRLRAADLFGRLGGEEFGPLFHHLSAEQSLECAERLREAIADLSVPDLPSVTVSIGLAEIDGSKDLEFAIAKADAALYAAKRDGRNRCVLVGNEREQLAA
jgi:diguanylate cyclase (GGDEF)-like protein